ncbi:hypothetical protein RRG08_050841 [Elysia crispata]|uniref:Uncharacterized protein n=1 Tax=Elysia crispata TaxID=231223 RepID=A0AAE1DX06_9GAST|nr:hypothetical protein RRG08_050841 [Elysia crispata]
MSYLSGNCMTADQHIHKLVLAGWTQAQGLNLSMPGRGQTARQLRANRQKFCLPKPQSWGSPSLSTNTADSFEQKVKMCLTPAVCPPSSVSQYQALINGPSSVCTRQVCIKDRPMIHASSLVASTRPSTLGMIF